MNSVFSTNGEKIVESLKFTQSEYRNLEKTLLLSSMAKGASDAPELPVVHEALTGLLGRIDKTQLTLLRKTR
jgi:hypothetical protein